MKTITFAIIGYGGIAKTHALACFDMNIKLALPFQLDLKYIFTRTPREFALPHPHVIVTHDLDDILNDPAIDFVSICTPNDSHAYYATRCMQAGKAVYCEKPLAPSASDAQKLADVAASTHSYTGVPLVYRYLPAARLLKQELEKSSIGQIIDFRGKLYHRSYLSEKKRGSWRTLSTSGGGASLDLCVHTLDLVDFLFQGVASTQSQKRIYFTDRSFVDEIARYQITLSNGAVGSIESSRVFAQNDQQDEFEVFGTKGGMKFNSKTPHELIVFHSDTNRTEILRQQDLLEPLFFPDERAYIGFFQSAHTACMADFVNGLATGVRPKNLADFAQCAKIEALI